MACKRFQQYPKYLLVLEFLGKEMTGCTGLLFSRHPQDGDWAKHSWTHWIILQERDHPAAVHAYWSSTGPPVKHVTMGALKVMRVVASGEKCLGTGHQLIALGNLLRRQDCVQLLMLQFLEPLVPASFADNLAPPRVIQWTNIFGFLQSALNPEV